LHFPDDKQGDRLKQLNDLLGLKDNMRSWARRALLICGSAFVLSLLLNSCDIYAQHRGVAPDGDQSVLWSFIYLVLPLMLAFAVIPLSLPFLFFKRTRRGAAIVALCGVTYVLGAKVCLGIGHRIRMQAFHEFAERSQTLVDAIESYNTTYGHYPDTLTNLVPEFLDAIPTTGMGAYPHYEYRTGTNSWYDNPYVISVDTPSGGINWDMFLYFPKHNYPQRDFGGVLERIGTWAYVHE